MKTNVLSAAVVVLSALSIAAQDSRPKGPEKAAILIVGPREFSTAVEPLIRHKKVRRPAEFVAIEDVLSSSAGVDDPEKLKRFLFERAEKFGLGYVLLVGDADRMPVRYMMLDRVTEPAFDVAFYPSDLYYADLAKADGTFDDWNARKDGYHGGYFGEVHGESHKDGPINVDQIDYRPDIAVGRWPVSTIAEVTRVVAKTIAYENSAAKSEALKRAVFCHVHGWIDARGALDRAITRLPKSYRAERLFFKDAARDDKTAAPIEAEILKSVNAGAGLVFHIGHGNDDQWAECFNVASIPKLTNTAAPAIMMSIGCSTARFAVLPPYEAYVDANGREHKGTNDGEVFKAPPPPPAAYHSGRYNPPGLGEMLVRERDVGAVAYIGCNTGGQPCALTLMEGMIDALAEVKSGAPILGDLWSRALTLYYDRENLATLRPNADWYPPSIFSQGMKYMFFGDPSLVMPSID